MKFSTISRFVARQPKWRIGVALALPLLMIYLAYGEDTDNSEYSLFETKRGDLKINILQGGNIEALERQEYICHVRGREGAKILYIVEEGYRVTEEDVAAGKVLIELDKSTLIDEITSHENEYQSALAALTEAQKNREIQISQNQSDVRVAELAVRFAMLDFKKYVGEQAAEEILVKRRLLPQTGTTTTGESTVTPEASGEFEEVAANPNPKPSFDFSKYADPELLGDGTAKQTMRTYEDELLVAQNQLGLVEEKFAGTQRLFDNDFVTKTALDTEQLSVEQSKLKVQTAKTNRDLFIKYEFPKAAEELLSNYEEAFEDLERTKKLAIARKAQADAKLREAESKFKLAEERRADLQEQLEACTLRAEKPGLIVYGDGENSRWGRDDEQVREGATVHERRVIMFTPSLSRLAVEVKIHESDIKKVAAGQSALVKLDAYPDKVIPAKVAKVGVLPSSENRWLNPDLKVYDTVVEIEGRHEWMKPGMSSEVEILIDEVKDVVYVPLQSIVTRKGQTYCFVLKKGEIVPTPIKGGQMNRSFIVVEEGLGEGEQVLLNPPRELLMKKLEA